MWSIHEVRDRHSVGLTMVFRPSHLDIVCEPGEAVHDALPGVAVDHVIVACHNNNIQGFWVDFLHIVKPESMGKGIYSGTWYGDIVAVHDIPIILLGGIVAWRSVELVESTVSDNELDPGVRIGKVAGLAGGTQVSAVGLFHTCQLSQPEAGEVPVIYGDLGLWVGLGVGADMAAPCSTLARGSDLMNTLGRLVSMPGLLSVILERLVVLALVSVVGDCCCCASTVTRLSVGCVAVGGMSAALVPVHYGDLYRQS